MGEISNKGLNGVSPLFVSDEIAERRHDGLENVESLLDIADGE